jgi:hypothetical protein
MNQTKSFYGGHGKGMLRKAVNPSSGVDSSNPCRRRGGGFTAMVVVFAR